MKEDPKDKRMQNLLSGKVKSDNEFVNYALGKMRECQAEKQNIVDRLKQGREAVKNLENALIALGSEFQKYGDDIAHFDPVLKKLIEAPELQMIQESESKSDPTMNIKVKSKQGDKEKKDEKIVDVV